MEKGTKVVVITTKKELEYFACHSDITPGTITEIVSVRDNHYRLDSSFRGLVKKEWVVEYNPNTDFKVGDTLIATKNHCGDLYKMGAIGTVVAVNKGGPLVHFKSGQFSKAHLPSGCGTGVHLELGMWWVYKGSLTKIKSKEGEQNMYLIKELKTYSEIQKEGRDLHNALSVKSYVKNLKDQKIKVYACREISAPDTAFVAFAVFPENYRGPDAHMFEKWGNKFINIRAYNNAKPSTEIMTYVKAWLYGQGIIEVPPTVKEETPADYTISNGKDKLLGGYGSILDLKAFIQDVAGQLMQGKSILPALRDLGYTVKHK